ncbi:hypothetical protein HDV00_004909 [Rhizophlyctis rosea]|nr:hypothetical protein HDV00_004909 [Rhizophlyctis rosea]
MISRFLPTTLLPLTLFLTSLTTPLLAQTTYPLPDTNITTSLTSLCTQMPGMPSCSLKSACQSSPTSIPSQYCTPFSLLSSACAKDMPTMDDCRQYNSVCNSTSPSYATCQAAALPSLPTTAQLAKQIYSICTEMSMDGCDRCKLTPTSTYAECDLLQTYSYLCKSMPSMSQCAQYTSLCSANPGLDQYCAVSATSDPPEMKMYFHTGIRDFVLFYEWVPRTTGHYVGALIGAFLLGLIYEAFQAAHLHLERVRSAPSDKKVLLSKGYHATSALIRGCSRLISATIAYLMMLVVMTYNVGLFFATVVGLGVGSAAFGEIARREAVKAGLEEVVRENEICC